MGRWRKRRTVFLFHMPLQTDAAKTHREAGLLVNKTRCPLLGPESNEHTQ